ncbi:glycosyltransferase family 4 protein [Myxacorys almedinensis]|uniref:Glycosyltransferase n=1 Tax=Myxacorys almedinensis A TaxID=2690445 RepID=A0A8J7Z1W2_9CYAN|nr:glycosyltransferase family 4 protein [Myxacorys almedinensis]NDJ16628.1 glycosyltransferase [Myxacorys almedinensis A]
MHLIVLENELTSQRGGQELNLLEVCRGLAHRGHRISLLYLKAGDLLAQYCLFCDRTIQIGSFGFDRRSVKDILKFLPSMAQVWQVPVSPDSVVFCNDYHFSLFGSALSYFRNLAYVCYLQIPPCDFNRQRTFGLSRVDRFIAVSQQTKRDWVTAGYAPDAIDVVYNGTNVEKFQPPADPAALRPLRGICDRATLISYVGRIDTEKGLETLIKAVALLSDRGVDLHLCLAGKPVVHYSASKGRLCEEEGRKYQRSLEALAHRLGVRDRITFLGHLADPVSLYQASDVTVLPSVWAEPFGRSIIESLACGTPVVASAIGGIPEILTGEFAAYLFAPGNAEALADRLEQVIGWRDRDPQFCDRARRHVATHFSDTHMVEGVERSLVETIPLGHTRMSQTS